VAVTTGTFTPLPPNAVRATGTPAPTPLPLVLYIDQLPPTARPSPTPAIPAVMPRALAGKILFVSDREGEPRLFALDPASGRLAYVTQSWPYALALAREARSPEGNRTVVVADNNVRIPQIYLRDAQFKDALKQLTTFTGMSYDPVWSPVEDRIAFVSEEPGNAEIYTMASDGSDVRRLTVNNWEWDKHPSWSPDGTQIIFWSNRVTGRRQLWIMNADGSNQRPFMDSLYGDWDPIWVK
jgi:Tol biopolymer transport system component